MRFCSRIKAGLAGRSSVLFGFLAVVALGGGCSWYYESDPTTILEPLNRLDHDFLSRRGAHTYIQATGPQATGAQASAVQIQGAQSAAVQATGVQAPDNQASSVDAADVHVPPNALFAREYSDLMSHFGQYKPILEPLAAPVDAMGCVIDSRFWYPTRMEQTFQCADGSVSLDMTYIGEQDFAVRVAARADFSGPDVTVRGCLADNGDGMLNASIEDIGGAVFIVQDATLYSFWGVEARDRRAYTIRAYGSDDAIPVQVEGACWKCVFPADQTVVVTFRVDQDWAVETGLEAVVPSEVPPIDSIGFTLSNLGTEDELAAWFRDAPFNIELDPMAMMAWFLLWENTAAPWGDKWAHEAVVPSKRHYFRGVWLWDAGFIALALASGNADARALGVNQIRNIVENAASDGRFPREVWAHDAGTGYQPPGILTWAAWELAIWGGDDSILDEFYDAFVANHQWFIDNTDSDGDGRCEWTREDSGMDTSPRFDDGPVEGVDLQAWLALDAQLLGWMAERIGRLNEVDAWLAENEARRKDIRENFWDGTDGMFYDRVIDDQAADPFVRVVTPVTFIPMMIGAATPAQAAAVAAHLDDRDYFGAPYGIPTTPVTSDVYESANYWRGPTWIVMNAFAFWGLLNYDFNDEATQLRLATIEMMNRSVTTWEYYDSTTGQGIGAPDFMWSAVFYLKMLHLDYTPFGLDHPRAD